MDTLGIGERSAVADVGAGGGWFTVRLARRVGPNGKVYAQDVQQQMLDSISRRVDREGFENVLYIRGERLDPKLPKAALDAVLMVDTYHEFENPVALLRGVGVALKPGGRVGIVNFRSDGGGPGPAVQRTGEGRARGGAGRRGRVEIARTRDVPRVSVFPDLRQVITPIFVDYADVVSADYADSRRFFSSCFFLSCRRSTGVAAKPRCRTHEGRREETGNRRRSLLYGPSCVRLTGPLRGPAPVDRTRRRTNLCNRRNLRISKGSEDLHSVWRNRHATGITVAARHNLIASAMTNG